MWSKVQEFLKKDMVYNRESLNEKKQRDLLMNKILHGEAYPARRQRYNIVRDIKI